MQQFSLALQKEKIHVVVRQNEEGLVYGITYVDHHSKCVFNGSHLGKEYSANGILQRCNLEMSERVIEQKHLQHQILHDSMKESIASKAGFSTLLDDIIRPEMNQNAAEPLEQKQFKRKRKKRQQQIHN